MRIYKHIIHNITFILVLFLLSCQSKNSGVTQELSDTSITESKELVITREQFQIGGMETGYPKPFTFRQTINARGYVVAAPGGIVRVSTLIPGKISHIKTKPGDFVNKGQILFTLEGNEIVLLQQEYSIARQKLKSVKANYTRQKNLSEKDVTAKKEFINAESEYMALLSEIEGLKTRLELINIDPEIVETGKINATAAVRSPIKGYVTGQELVLGEFIEPNESVIEIIDTDQLQLELDIFETSLDALEPGQVVYFNKPDNKSLLFKAKLISLGKAIDPETKTVKCLAEIPSKDRQKLVHHQYVEASIITCHREALAIPDDALIEEDEKYYVLSLSNETGDSLFFRKTLTSIGVIQQDHAEILDKNLKTLLIKGVYSISGNE